MFLSLIVTIIQISNQIMYLSIMVITQPGSGKSSWATAVMPIALMPKRALWRRVTLSVQLYLEALRQC